MVKPTGTYPHPHIDTAKVNAIGQAGGVLLTETIRTTGLDQALGDALSPWASRAATHHPGKILLDLALTLALGGDSLADIALLRGEPDLYGPVASDPTVSRMISLLAGDPDRVLAAINTARAAARATAWTLAGAHAPNHNTSARNPLVIDLDATLLTAHSVKEHAAPTFKKGFGHHPLAGFIDHGSEGTGECGAIKLRAGNAGSNTAADHIEVTRACLAQIPGLRPGVRPGRRILIRTDGGGGTKRFISWLAAQRLSYSIGFTLPANTPELLAMIPEHVWAPALDSEGEVRDGAWVAELTGLMDLASWPEGMRVIVRKERPHPGAQLRFEDVDGMRVTAFVTNTTRGQLADLELRHRRRARCEDRIRIAKDAGLRNLPLYSFDQNRIWCQVVSLAVDLLAWAQMLALHGHEARRWEPKRLRLRLFTVPAAVARSGRRLVLHVSDRACWAGLVLTGVGRLRRLPAPG